MAVASSTADLENRIGDYFTKQGYRISKDAKVLGKSGIEQYFDLLARFDDGFASHTVAVIVKDDLERQAQLKSLFEFANKAYDAGVPERVFINTSPMDRDIKGYALKQRITAIDAQQLTSLMSIKRKGTYTPRSNNVFKSNADLIGAVTGLGYRVEKNAKVRGRSGTEYSFDILAYGDNGLVAYSLAIDFFNQGEVSLEQISVFDTKVYDVGIDHKVIFVNEGLSPEAKQFAELQQIKVIQPSKETGTATEEKPVEKAKPEETDKAKEKTLRQLPQPEAVQLIPEVMARRYSAIPLSISGNTLLVAMSNPTDIFALEAFAAQSKKRVKPLPATADEVREAIDFNYKAYGEIEEHLSRITITNEVTQEKVVLGGTEDAPLTQALNLIIEEATKARSSDIHIDPEENRLRIRYRIDGVLHDTMSLPISIHRPLISRIKILSLMNIADHFRPQDGQFSTTVAGRQLDVRVATAPTIHGEMAVLRLLDKSIASRGLAEIGFLPDQLERYKNLLKYPYGMIIASGPTGSGKTTTLYASISSLDTLSKNIVTIEDPAEYHFKDINQIQVNVQAGITFASGLRSILRLDPNIILVGEIRDAETANIAVQAALTGHLMLSSLHANDSTGAFFRLIDLGIERFLLASSLVGVVAQRMVRKICPDCSRSIEAPVIEQIAYEKIMGEKRTHFQYGTGCASCSFTGYLGRTGLFELLTVSDQIRKMISDEASKTDIRNQATADGMTSMMKDGMLKVNAGITTPSEVINATYTQE